MSADLVAFLRARYDEIEAAIRAWNRDDPHPGVPCDSLDEYDSCGLHIAAWKAHERIDPYSNHEFGLADIAAKRKIVEALAREDDCGCDAFNHHDHEPVLRLLAAPFRAHPDFDPAWVVE